MAGEMFDWGSGRNAVMTIAVKVPQLSRDAFLDQMKAFAEANRFDVRVARIHPVKEQFAIDMWRKDIAVSSENVFDPTDFEVDFYVDPDNGGTGEAVQKIVDDMRQRLVRVPHVTMV